jgi:hypothetical protein
MQVGEHGQSRRLAQRLTVRRLSTVTVSAAADFHLHVFGSEVPTLQAGTRLTSKSNPTAIELAHPALVGC